MDVISLKSTVQTAPHNFRAQDQTDYSAITYFVDSKSVLKLQGPSATLYNNTNFASPDFNYPGTLTKDMDIPLVSNAIPQGTYILTATTRITKTCPIISINLGSNYILVDLALLDNFTAGQTITLAGGPNAGTYTIQSISSNAFGTILTLTQTLLSGTATDEVTFDEEIITIETYTYCFTAPVPVLVLTPSCETATLAVSQNTNYAITCEGQSIQPTTNSPSVTLNAPLNSSSQPVYPQTVSGALPFSTTELWTQTWKATIVTTLVYELPSGLFIETSVTSTKSIDVTCDDSLCCMSQCLQNATNTFNTALASGNFNTILLALEKYTQILGAFMMYSVGVKCGDTNTINTAIANMKSYLADTDCCNNCNDNGQSVQIIPIYNVIVSGNNVVVEAPDVYLDLSTTVVGSTTTYSLTLNTTQVENLISTYIIANPTIITNIVNDMRLKTFISGYPGAIDVAVRFSGITAVGSPVISSIIFASGIDQDDITEGEPIYHANFPIGTYILSIAANGDITASQNATFTGATNNVIIGGLYRGASITKYKRTLSGIDSYNFVTTSSVQKSIVWDNTTGSAELDGDEAAPGNYQYYGTDSGGTKGMHSLLGAFTANIEENHSSVAATIPNGSSVTGATLTLDVGSVYILLLSARIVRQLDGQVIVTIEEDGVAFYTTAFSLDSVYNPNENLAIMFPRAVGGLGVITFKFTGNGVAQTGALKDRMLAAIKIA